MPRLSKQSITYIITLCLYAISIYYLFFVVQLWQASIAVLALLVSIHFAVISIKDFQRYIRGRNRVLWILVSGAIVTLTTHYSPFLIGIAYLVFHGGLYFYVLGKNGFLQNTISPHVRYYANSSMYLFTVFYTISISILMIGILGKIPFSCQTIQEDYKKVGVFFTTPLGTGFDRFAVSDTSIEQKKTIGIAETTGDIGTRLGELFVVYKNQLFQEVFSGRQKLNTDICNYLFESIQIQLQKPGFQLAILLPLFLILSPIIRLILYIVSFLMMCVMWVLIKVGVYRKHTTTKEVEERY